LLAQHARLPKEFERVELPSGRRLVAFGEVGRYAYFPLEGVISFVSVTRTGHTVEVAAVGKEGVAGAWATAAASPSPFDLIVQVPGSAIRVQRAGLMDLFAQPRTLRFFHLLIGEIAQSAVCNRYHSGTRRLVKWLLMVADRANSDTIPLTHQFAAFMLGAGRPRVTAAMNQLRRRGFVGYQRGQVTLIDRPALVRQSCDCYETFLSSIDPDA